MLLNKTNSNVLLAVHTEETREKDRDKDQIRAIKLFVYTWHAPSRKNVGWPMCTWDDKRTQLTIQINHEQLAWDWNLLAEF